MRQFEEWEKDVEKKRQALLEQQQQSQGGGVYANNNTAELGKTINRFISIDYLQMQCWPT